MYHIIKDEKRREWYEKNFEERFNCRRWVGKSYFDKPDGEDLSGKVWFAMKFGSAAGIISGILNAYAPPFTKSHQERIVKFSKSFFPVLMASNTYVLVTYMATNIRKKDDSVNHFLGGCAAGSVIGAGFRSCEKGFGFMLLLGFFGAALKFSIMHNVDLLNHPNNNYHSPFFLRKFDTTLYKDDIRGNWTKEPKN